MAGGVTISTLEPRKASDRTDAGQEHRPVMRYHRPGPLVPPAEDGLLCELPAFVALPRGAEELVPPERGHAGPYSRFYD